MGHDSNISSAKEVEVKNFLPQQTFATQFSDVRQIDIFRSKTGDDTNTAQNAAHKAGNNLSGVDFKDTSMPIFSIAKNPNETVETQRNDRRRGSEQAKSKGSTEQSYNESLALVSEGGHAVFQENQEYTMKELLKDGLGGFLS